MKVGYARVSTTEQEHSEQIKALKAFGCDKVYSEKQSGKTADNRTEWNRALSVLDAGDTLVAAKVDRLGRNFYDISDAMRSIRKRGAGFHSLASEEQMLCFPPASDETGADVSALLIALLSWVAAFERKRMLQRTAEGRAAKKARGESIGGRKPKLSEHQKQEVRKRLADGETTVALAKSYGVSHQTIGRCQGLIDCNEVKVC